MRIIKKNDEYYVNATDLLKSLKRSGRYLDGFQIASVLEKTIEEWEDKLTRSKQ